MFRKWPEEAIYTLLCQSWVRALLTKVLAEEMFKTEVLHWFDSNFKMKTTPASQLTSIWATFSQWWGSASALEEEPLSRTWELSKTLSFCNQPLWVTSESFSLRVKGLYQFHTDRPMPWATLKSFMWPILEDRHMR